MPDKQDWDWRKEPAPSHFSMCHHEVCGETIFPASDSYTKDRARMAREIEIGYVEVRMKTEWMVWGADEAEEEWRRDRCECEDGPCDDLDQCETTKPAESLWDFWDEDGTYCPWRRCDPSTKGAVKFRVPNVTAMQELGVV